MTDVPDVVKKKYWGDSVGLLRKTTPFLMLNMAVYTAFFLAVVLWLGIFGGLAVFFATRLEIVAWLMMFIAIAAPAGVLAFARRYILYMVQGAHIAVVTKMLLEGSVPQGKGQVEYGREVVKSNFRDVSVLFLLDRLIDGTLRSFSNSFVRLVDFLPLGGQMTQIARLITQIVRRSLSYVDEAVLSYAIARDEPNVWRSSRHGIILYAQAYKPILGTAVKVWLMGRVAFIAALVVFAIPGFLVLSVFDSAAFQVAVIVATLLLAHLTVLAVFEPFAVIYVMVTYHKSIAGLTPDPVWDQRLQQVSKKFRELIGKARESATPDAAPDPLDAAPQGLAEGSVSPDGGAGASGTTSTLGASGAQGTPPAPAAPAAPRTPRGIGGGLGAIGGGRAGGLGGLLGKAAEQLMAQPSQPTAPPSADVPPAAAPAPTDEGSATASTNRTDEGSSDV
jgi:hypothetical protein